MENLKQTINSQINNLKQTSELEIEFLKILLYSYEYQKNNNLLLNYNVIKNLKHCSKILNRVEFFKNLNEKEIKFISYLEYMTNYKMSNLKYNFKTYSNLSDCKEIKILRDERLAFNTDKALIICNKNTFEKELEIIFHSLFVNSFNQLENGKIIIGFTDGIIKIIKLVNYTNYIIEQTLNSHTRRIIKIIEIKKNEIISIASDKIMKMWNLNNKNKFECFLNFEINIEYFPLIDKINENEFVTCLFNNHSLEFFNSNNYSIITRINNFEHCINNFICYKEDFLLVLNLYSIYLIKISNHQIINKIKEKIEFLSINKSIDNKIICYIKNENDFYSIAKFDLEENKLKIIFEFHTFCKKKIDSIIELKNGIIVFNERYDPIIRIYGD